MTKFPDHWSTTSITPNMAQPYNTIVTSEIVSKLLEKQFPVKLFCRLHRSVDDEDDPEEVLWKKVNTVKCDHGLCYYDQIYQDWQVPNCSFCTQLVHLLNICLS
jgi:hypothetical protein